MPKVKRKWILNKETGMLQQYDVYMAKKRKAEIKGLIILSFLFVFFLSVVGNVVLAKENRYLKEQVEIYESQPDYNGFQD